MATKAQRLRTTAEGFMVGLALADFEGPWRWANYQWEGSFYHAWREWPPARLRASDLPSFKLGGHGRDSQPREILWELKRTSPFHNYRSEPLNREPFGLTLEEYVEIWVKVASADEWRDLATAFLEDMATFTTDE